MPSFKHLIAIAAVAVLPTAAIVSTASADDPYAPYQPYTPAATPTPAPGVVPTPTPTPVVTSAVVLKNVQTAVATAFKTLKFARVLGQGHSTVSIPIQGAGTYTVTISYRAPGKKYKSIAKGATSIKVPGKTVSLAIKPNKNGKALYKSLKKSKKSTINVQVSVSYETGGKTVTTTFNRKFKK